MNKVIERELQKVTLPSEIAGVLYGKTILITGATGLIGTQLIYVLGELNRRTSSRNQPIHIVAYVRNKEKADKQFEEYLSSDWFEIMVGDIADECSYEGRIDYMVHSASFTASNSFINTPIEVTHTIIAGTERMLELAERKQVKSFVYLSSMEAYGFTTQKKSLGENDQEYVNPLTVRSCYPLSKRMAENMCISYWSERKVPARIIRLAQTFGVGVDKQDTRVFAEFARCAAEERDIELKTDGKSSRMYLYTLDAATAILTVLISGENGQAYNAANQDTFCSIREMAQMVCDKVVGGKISVQFHTEGTNSQFSPSHMLYLDTTALENLGWHAGTSLEDMYKRMIESWNE